MRIARASLRTLSILSIAILAFASAANGQRVRIPASALLDNAEIQRVVSEGQQLERSSKWGDALTHYEDAIKKPPGHRELERRLQTTRRRFSLSRRFADSSYVRSVNSLTTQKALNLYNEVLGKIQLHFVGKPSWRELVQNGTENLAVALSDPSFRQKYAPTAKDIDVDAFLQRLRQRLDGRRHRTRLDAELSANIASGAALQELGIPEPAVILEYACGASNTLDNYSAFLTPDQYDDVMSQIEGNFVGLGIELKADNGALLLVNVIQGGPADVGGLRKGDRITEVDRKLTRSLSTDAAADLLRGVDGSQVELMVLSPSSQEPKRVRLLRRRVQVPSIEDVKIIDSQLGVGYLKLTSLQKTTTTELDNALWDLHNQGMRSLIVDVRGNPGGLLPASVKAVDRFVTSGVIVSTRGRNVREDFDYEAHAAGTWRVPLIVLIDGNSASASEIFAGAIHDLKRGTVIGQRSYGKGSVQGIFPLIGSSAGIRLTTAKFYSPSGRAISKNGVVPNIAVQVAAKPVVNGKRAPRRDDVLDHAVQFARNSLSAR